jgi:hypothetical protein
MPLGVPMSESSLPECHHTSPCASTLFRLETFHSGSGVADASAMGVAQCRDAGPASRPYLPRWFGRKPGSGSGAGSPMAHRTRSRKAAGAA